MRKFFFIGYSFLCFSGSLLAQQAGSINMQQLVRDNFTFADSQYRYMMTLTPRDRMPQSYDEKRKNLFLTNARGGVRDFTPAHYGIFMSKLEIQ
ncbi:hypothetical protein [Niabella ginsengisoli]|uniref:Uncharacterized protein n=1 Tax=Niabella ginsengisoli TaxID=522298 RepID=A0ABS9SJD1_9BACT|nr:hypothetical protein [Niabella ginsengisoli]MCH5598294.1 hypothetical protein [Niabella ginsengisoli]